MLNHDVPSALALNLDQIPLSYVSPGKYRLSSKVPKNVPIKGFVTLVFEASTIFEIFQKFIPFSLLFLFMVCKLPIILKTFIIVLSELASL